MSGPGSGRYTTYVPTASPRNEMLSKLFNAKSPKGDIYGKAYETNNAAAAASAVTRAIDNDKGMLPADNTQAGDLSMFPNGVKFNFSDAPNVANVKWDSPKFSPSGVVTNFGGPANAYVPDISSPGAGKTQGIDKDVDPKITTADIKPDYTPGSPGTGTTSPSTTSPLIGASSLTVGGKTLVMGKSSV
jgi:hypothetical protein